MQKETWTYSKSGNVSICINHGSVEIETREISIKDGIAYQGRSVHRNKYGGITKITPWETTLTARY